MISAAVYHSRETTVKICMILMFWSLMLASCLRTTVKVDDATVGANATLEKYMTLPAGAMFPQFQKIWCFNAFLSSTIVLDKFLQYESILRLCLAVSRTIVQLSVWR